MLDQNLSATAFLVAATWNYSFYSRNETSCNEGGTDAERPVRLPIEQHQIGYGTDLKGPRFQVKHLSRSRPRHVDGVGQGGFAKGEDMSNTAICEDSGASQEGSAGDDDSAAGQHFQLLIPLTVTTRRQPRKTAGIAGQNRSRRCLYT